jgi:hypothetical protein
LTPSERTVLGMLPRQKRRWSRTVSLADHTFERHQPHVIVPVGASLVGRVPGVVAAGNLPGSARIARLYLAFASHPHECQMCGATDAVSEEVEFLVPGVDLEVS